MWIYTTEGFFSIVQKPGDKLLTVRVRAPEDLDRLRAKWLPSLGPTSLTPAGDYCARATCTRQAYAEALSAMALALDYSNFKSRLAQTIGGPHLEAAHEVWHAMHALTAKVSAKKPTTKPGVKPPHASPTPGRKMSYGAVVVDKTHARVLLREPTNHFDGYVWTFAKGRLDPGETPEVCAQREVCEELGITARIIGQVPGIFAGGTGDNEYFIAEYEADAGPTDKETDQVRWATWDEAPALIKLTTNPKGQKRDLEVLALARKSLKK